MKCTPANTIVEVVTVVASRASFRHVLDFPVDVIMGEDRRVLLLLERFDLVHQVERILVGLRLLLEDWQRHDLTLSPVRYRSTRPANPDAGAGRFGAHGGRLIPLRDRPRSSPSLYAPNAAPRF